MSFPEERSMKKILVIQGHPDKESFCYALAQAYRDGAQMAGADVKLVNVGELRFNPLLAHGYRKPSPLEDDLVEIQEMIKGAEHLVFVYPTWWWSMPALLKGFIDRVFLAGFGFKYRTDSIWWDRLLTGKSARLIVTMDSPVWYHWIMNRGQAHLAMKKMTLEFCGIKPVRTTTYGSVRRSSEATRKQWVMDVERLGKQCI
jgi:putative NADPH-quinone reductase